MTKLMIVRHGQGNGNLKKEFHGQTMSELTELGHKQAECTALYLKDTPIDVFYASDIPRAYQTAVHTAEKRGMTVIPDKNLREIDAGQWEEVLFDELDTRFHDDYALWCKDLAHSRPTGGESVAEMYTRVVGAVKKIIAEHDGQTVFIASHATPIRAMISFFSGNGVEGMNDIGWVTNASVTEVDCEGDTYTLRRIGDDAHLIAAGMITALPRNI